MAADPAGKTHYFAHAGLIPDEFVALGPIPLSRYKKKILPADRFHFSHRLINVG